MRGKYVRGLGNHPEHGTTGTAGPAGLPAGAGRCRRRGGGVPVVDRALPRSLAVDPPLGIGLDSETPRALAVGAGTCLPVSGSVDARHGRLPTLLLDGRRTPPSRPGSRRAAPAVRRSGSPDWCPCTGQRGAHGGPEPRARARPPAGPRDRCPDRAHSGRAATRRAAAARTRRRSARRDLHGHVRSRARAAGTPDRIASRSDPRGVVCVISDGGSSVAASGTCAR